MIILFIDILTNFRLKCYAKNVGKKDTRENSSMKNY